MTYKMIKTFWKQKNIVIRAIKFPIHSNSQNVSPTRGFLFSLQWQNLFSFSFVLLCIFNCQGILFLLIFYQDILTFSVVCPHAILRVGLPSWMTFIIFSIVSVDNSCLGHFLSVIQNQQLVKVREHCNLPLFYKVITSITFPLLVSEKYTTS